MKPHQQSQYQVGSVPRREGSSHVALGALLLLCALLAGLAAVSPAEPSTSCAAPAQVANQK